jgi:hypothetical protein
MFGNGCGAGSYQASAGTKFEIDGAGREIDDTDVAKAFEAHPQIGEKMRVAYYTFDDTRADDVEKMLATVPGVTTTYRIPKLLVSGQRRFEERWSYGPQPELSVKKLRLLAARAHADVLLVFDHGWRGGGVNGLVALNILIVPIFITPWLSTETESYAQAFVIDVRNGYIYGEVSADAKGGKSMATIYSDGVDTVAQQQWPQLLDTVKGQLTTKVRENKKASSVSTPTATQ